MTSSTTPTPAPTQAAAGAASGDTTELDDFDGLTSRYQRELLAHCYRMSGSVHEAEDLVQETFLRAWKASASFQGRSSVRTWLYRIATNVCLTNLEGKPRRPLPAGLGTPDQLAGDALEQNHEITWPSRCRTLRSSSPSATRSGWPSSRRCSTCPRASAPC